MASSRALGHYEPSLDGLRWIAMSIMLAFHAGFEWGQGAAFSLSMFFTLSGFLITSLLLRGRDSRGRPQLRTFWVKRFRRLMPAAVLTLAAIVVVAPFLADARQLAKLPGQVISALFYVVNWYFVVSDQSYVDQFSAPSPVVHFWSLAVEEQFYLVMPIVLLLLLRRVRSMIALAACFLGGALVSLLWTLYLYDNGASFDRIYYGTDTRAAEFLVGAALACVLHRYPLDPSRWARWLLIGGGFVALGITVVLWTTVPLTEPALYQGGFAAFSLVSTLLIVSLLSRAGPLPAILAWGPLAALGRITYGVYLVQWPIFLWLDEERTGLSRWPLLIVQLGLTLSLAALMYNLIESPIRQQRWLVRPHSWVVVPAAAAAIVIGVLVVGALPVDEEDPLVALEQTADAAAPVVGSDNVLDVLVIGDERATAVTEELQTAAEARDDVELTVGPAFGCPSPAPTPGAGCDAWAQEWGAAIEAEDPDVVLLLVAAWPDGQLERLSGLGPDADDSAREEWTAETVAQGLDILSSQGATVIWAPILPTSIFEVEAIETGPFYVAMEQLLSERRDLRVVYGYQLEFDGVTAEDPAWSGLVADALLRSGAAYDRRDIGDVPRILVVGDSIGASLGIGLERWGSASGDAVVWTTAQLGCAIAYEGVIHWEFGSALDGRFPQPPRCLDAEEAWADQIEQFDPDVVVVSSTILDMSDHQLPGDDAFIGPGDPTYDDFLIDKYTEAYDILSAGGAEVVWLTGSCYEGGVKADEIDYLNDELLPRLQEERPDLRIFPFADITCPGGEFTPELGDVEDARFDGIHFSPAAGQWFGETHGAELLGTP